jgi:Arc/MetJ-type ribon-helix-helix transcriptional regulator
MNSLIHIRVGKALKKEMQDLIDKGLFSNQSEVAREGIRHILLKYHRKEDED